MTTATIRLVLNDNPEAYYLEAAPDHRFADLREALAEARDRGYEPMDEDECESEITSEGWVRIYLAQVVTPAPHQRTPTQAPAALSGAV